MSAADVALEHASGTRARVAPSRGMNCYQLEVPVGERTVSVLWAEAGFASGQGRPSASGIPVLFPFPGRMQGNRLRYQGREYRFPYEDGLGNAIHGLVLEQPWQLVERQEDWAVGRFRASEHLSGGQECWPCDFELELTYALLPQGLRVQLVVRNPDRQPLPWGAGLHPYFALPLGERGSFSSCRLYVPAAAQVPLREMIPTGSLLRGEGTSAEQLARDRPLDELELDDVLTELRPSPKQWEAAITDPENHLRLRILAEGFPHAVVYTPPHRQAVCVEPYTCIPGVFNLVLEDRWQGGFDPGVRFLPPGQEARLQMTVQVEPLA